ncbi:MAG: hypothetical protein HWD61_01175 [Parachlamydiaceae bacterium]|nr:MAG: hypothetical protein HWD61_01175 [Parachlamydiaceae bacterium]
MPTQEEANRLADPKEAQQILHFLSVEFYLRISEGKSATVLLIPSVNIQIAKPLLDELVKRRVIRAWNHSYKNSLNQVEPNNLQDTNVISNVYIKITKSDKFLDREPRLIFPKWRDMRAIE